jgi:hypothetical protein
VTPRRHAGRRAAAPASLAPVLVLDVRYLRLQDALQADVFGQLVWTKPAARRITALYSFKDDILTIHEIAGDRDIETANLSIRIEYLPAFRGGGKRPWFVCPAAGESGPCGSRALKLFLPEGETAFRCRRCLGRDGLRHPQVRLSGATAHRLNLSAGHVAARPSA